MQINCHECLGGLSVVGKIWWAGGCDQVAGSSGNKANLAFKLKLGLGIILAKKMKFSLLPHLFTTSLF